MRDGASSLFAKDASGGNPETPLAKLGDGGPNAVDWSRDGKSVLYFRQQAKTGFDLMVLPLEDGATPFAFQESGFNETDGSFSPDTKWVAYTSDESDKREEIYVQPFPTPGTKYRVSANGGSQPVWRADGRELFFLAPDGTMMAAPVSFDAGFEPGTPQPLFATGVAFTGNRRQYAVSRDGRFLVNVPQQGSSGTPLTVVINWRPATQ